MYRAVLPLVVALSAVPGCTSGSLATDSGPGGGWSTQKLQYVHVGERVDFSSVIASGTFRKVPRNAFGIVDYCIATAGDERIEAELDGTGRFRFSYNVVGLNPGETVIVTATSYQEKGIRDIMQIGDEWVRAEMPSDPGDIVMATASVKLLVYKTRVELPVVDRDGELDFESGRLELHKHDGEITNVYAATGGRRGFTVEESESAGTFLVTYDPTADQINKYGDTYVRFTAFDRSGGAHEFDGYCPTP